MIETLQPENGCMRTVVPHGVHRQKVKSVKQLQLIEENLLDTVIGLPENLCHCMGATNTESRNMVTTNVRCQRQ